MIRFPIAALTISVCLVVLLFTAGEASVLPSCSNSTSSTLCTITFTDGSKYVGEWRGHRRHGQGSETSTDGSVKEGVFKDGEFQHEEKGSSTVLAEVSCDYNMMREGAEGMLAFYACMAKLGPGEQKRVFQQEQERVARENRYRSQQQIARKKREEQERIARQKREREQEQIARKKREEQERKEEASKSHKLEEANDNIRLALDILNYTVSGSKESREEVIVLNAKNCIFQVVTIWGKEKLYVNNIILDTVKLYSMKVNNPLFNQLQDVYYVGFDGDKRVLGNLTSGRMVLAQNADLDRVRKAWGLLFSKACKGASPSEF